MTWTALFVFSITQMRWNWRDSYIRVQCFTGEAKILTLQLTLMAWVNVAAGSQALKAVWNLIGGQVPIGFMNLSTSMGKSSLNFLFTTLITPAPKRSFQLQKSVTSITRGR